MKWQWLAVIGAAAGIGATGLWLVKKFREDGGTPACEENSSAKNSRESREQDSTDNKAEDRELCRVELERFGSKFESLYMPLRQVAEQTGYRVNESSLVFSWGARLKNDERFQGLSRKWQSLQDYSDRERLEKWYFFLLSLGVSCSTEQSVVLDEEVMRKYDFVDDWEPYVGQTLEVRRRYWYLGDTILEKGDLEESADAQEE